MIEVSCQTWTAPVVHAEVRRICLFVCLPVRLSVCLLACLFDCLFVCLFVCLFDLFHLID